MPTLHELQTAMRLRLLDWSDASAAAILADTLAPLDRLSIYRNTSRTTLTNALRLNYPVVQRLVGEEFFAAAADSFIAEEPPGAAWLDVYGGGFSEFLEGFAPVATLPYLADVARLERAVGHAFHAADVTPLRVSTLANVAASRQAQVCFKPHLSVRLVSSNYPVDAIWRAVLTRDEGALAAIDLGAGSVHLLVERRCGDVEVTRLDPERWKFSEAVFSGHSLAVSFDGVNYSDVAGWLAEHLAAGHFIDFVLEDAG